MSSSIINVQSSAYYDIMEKQNFPWHAVKHTYLYNFPGVSLLAATAVYEGRAVVIWKDKYPVFILKPKKI